MNFTGITGKHEKDDDFPASFGYGGGTGPEGDWPTEGEMIN